jgi:hypothetical protein
MIKSTDLTKNPFKNAYLPFENTPIHRITEEEPSLSFITPVRLGPYKEIN